jgi:hypothetical protein
MGLPSYGIRYQEVGDVLIGEYLRDYSNIDPLRLRL